MSRLNVWHQVPVNTSNRPILVQGESELVAADHVGLYQGKSKLVALQNGRIYLTTERVIFLDESQSSANGPVPPGVAVGVQLRLFHKTAYVDKFLRSSPKVKLYLRSEAGAPVSAPRISDWVCGVCSFNNHFDHSEQSAEPAPVCVACGIAASAAQVRAMTETETAADAPVSAPVLKTPVLEAASEVSEDPAACPKCTFHNHPSMRFCEMCGAPLKVSQPRAAAPAEADPPAFLRLSEPETYTDNEPYVKISFRKGGHRQFFEAATRQIDRLNWEDLQAKGAVNQQATRVGADARAEPPRARLHGGIAAIERSGEMQRLANERVLSSSLNDLEQLMHKAPDVLRLAQSFRGVVKRKGEAGGKAGGKRKYDAALGSVGADSEYTPLELARYVSEFLVNHMLTRPTAMATVQDVFAAYNRHRLAAHGFGGRLVGAAQIHASLQQLDRLQLPVTTKKFRSGMTVVVLRNGAEQSLPHVIVDYLVAAEDAFMMAKFEAELGADADGYLQAQHRFFPGKTVVELAEHFGWATSVCAEELERCLSMGLLVQDNHISGTFYHVNKFDAQIAGRLADHAVLRARARDRVVQQQTSISAALRSQNDLLLSVHDYATPDTCSPETPSPTDHSDSLMQLNGLRFD